MPANQCCGFSKHQNFVPTKFCDNRPKQIIKNTIRYELCPNEEQKIKVLLK
jgi:hypothetical protein